MAGYVKKIALIRGIKSGFSADGGELSGLVKAESYAGFLKAEVSLINFAPLCEGQYVFGLTDGVRSLSFTSEVYEGEEALELTRGFAALVCFRHTSLTPVAAAVCGNLQAALPKLKEFMEREEIAGETFDDEAIAEVNYYELQTDEGGNAVCENEEEKADGGKRGEDEADTGSLQKGEGIAECGEREVAAMSKGGAAHGEVGGNGVNGGNGGNGMVDNNSDDSDGENIRDGGAKTAVNLAGGDFYARMSERIEEIFSSYPKDEQLQRAMEGSRWAKIEYGEGKYYSFGVIYVDGEAQYICYGVPAKSATPPESLQGRAAYIATESGGYFVLFQDARTGVSVEINCE